MAPNPSLRVGDADRDAVAEVLREAHAEGRLSVTELQERLDAAYGAKTYGELAPVTADLPTPAAPRAVPSPRPSTVTSATCTPRPLAAAWTAWATVVMINLVVWAAVSAGAGWVYFWPVWVAGPWGAVLLVSTVSSRVGQSRRA